MSTSHRTLSSLDAWPGESARPPLRLLETPRLMSQRRAAPELTHPLGGRTTQSVGLGALSRNEGPLKRPMRAGWLQRLRMVLLAG